MTMISMTLAEAQEQAALSRRLRGLPPLPGEVAHVDAPPPGAAALRRVEIIDVDAARTFDRLLTDGAIVRLNVSGSESLTISKDAKPAIVFHPHDAGDTPTHPLNLATYEALCEQCGSDPTGDVTGEHDGLGAATVREHLADLSALEAGLFGWAGCGEVARRLAEAEGRSLGMSPATIATCTGRTYVPRRSLLVPCSASRLLTEQRLAREAEAAAAAAKAEAARLEALKPRSVLERGLDGVVLRRDRLGANERLDGDAPFPFAVASFQTNDEVFYLWGACPGVTVPIFNLEGCRSVRPDDVVPQGARIGQFTIQALIFVKGLRSRVKPELDLGPVTTWIDPTAETLEIARGLVAQHSRDLLNPRPATHFWASLVCEQIVRGLCMSPIDAAVRCFQVLDAAAALAHERKVVPSIAGPAQNGRATPPAHRPSDALRKGGLFFGEACIAAAAGGIVSAGCLLPKTLPSSTKPQITTGQMAIQKD